MFRQKILETIPPKSTLFGPQNLHMGEKYSPVLNTTIKNRILFAIEHNDIPALHELLQQNPDLPNAVLDAEGKTALILAIIKNQNQIAEFLLVNGADTKYLDYSGYAALDYASAAINTYLYNLMEGAYRLPAIRLINFRVDIDFALGTILCEKINAQLKKHETEEYEPAKLLDLYCTAHTLFKIISQSVNEAAFKEKFLLFLETRENFLAGDGNDYCYSKSLANELCAQLVELLFPKEHVPNVLLKNALTKNRKEPWFDVCLQTSLLPDNPFEYFRTFDNRIHLYDQVVTQAINQLKRGYVKMTDIWLGSDKHPPTTEDEKPTEWLTASDLENLKQRTPTLETLINYTQRLETSIGNHPLYERFSQLRKGLLQGDYKHGGTELQAGSEAYIEVAEFSEWWNILGKSKEGKNTQTNLRALHRGALGEILDIILDEGNATKRDRTVYCIKLKGDKLEEILSKPDILDAMNKMEKNIDWRVSHEQLDRWEKRILEELKNPSLQNNITKQFKTLNQFTGLSRNPSLFTFVDYDFLADVKNTLPLLNITALTEQKEQTQKLLKTIFSINNLNEFLLPYAHHCFYNKSENLLTSALRIQYMVLCLRDKTLDEKVQRHYRFVKPLINFHKRNYPNSHIKQCLISAIENNHLLHVTTLAKFTLFTNIPTRKNEHCDVLDTTNQWRPAVVIDTRPNKIMVHYVGWTSRWDEWLDIEIHADRIAPFETYSNNNNYYLKLAFDHKNLDIATILIDSWNIQIKNQAFFQEARSAEEWQFIGALLATIKKEMITSDFLRDLILKASTSAHWFFIDSMLQNFSSIITANTLNNLLGKALEQGLPQQANKLLIAGASLTATRVRVNTCAWNFIFSLKNYPTLAMTHIDRYGLGFEEQQALLTLGNPHAWQFIQELLTTDLSKFNADFLSQVLEKAIIQSETTVFNLIKNNVRLEKKHIAAAFEAHAVSKLEDMLTIDTTITHSEALLLAVNHGQRKDIANVYLKFRTPPVRTLAQIVTHAVQHDDLAQVQYLLSLPGLPFIHDAYIWNIAYKNKNFKIAAALTKLVEPDYRIMLKANTAAEWIFIVNYLPKIERITVDDGFLENLLLHAMRSTTHNHIAALIFYIKEPKLSHLRLAFQMQSPQLIEEILKTNRNLHDDSLALSAIRAKEWQCVNSYVKYSPLPADLQTLMSNTQLAQILNNFRELLDTLPTSPLEPLSKRLTVVNLYALLQVVTRDASLNKQACINILLGCLSLEISSIRFQPENQAQRNINSAVSFILIKTQFLQALQTAHLTEKQNFSEDELLYEYKNYASEKGVCLSPLWHFFEPHLFQNAFQMLQSNHPPSHPELLMLDNQILLTIQTIWQNPKYLTFKPQLLHILSLHNKLQTMVQHPANYSPLEKESILKNYHLAALNLPPKSALLKKLSGIMLCTAGVVAMILGVVSLAVSFGMSAPVSYGLLTGGLAGIITGRGLFKSKSVLTKPMLSYEDKITSMSYLGNIKQTRN